MEKEEKIIHSECISAINELAIKNPNDMELGGEVRKFLNSLKKD